MTTKYLWSKNHDRTSSFTEDTEFLLPQLKFQTTTTTTFLKKILIKSKLLKSGQNNFCCMFVILRITCEEKIMKLSYQTLEILKFYFFPILV